MHTKQLHYAIEKEMLSLTAFFMVGTFRIIFTITHNPSKLA